MKSLHPEPAYLDLLHTGELKARVACALHHLEACDLCPWECGVNRLESSSGPTLGEPAEKWISLEPRTPFQTYPKKQKRY